MSEDDKPVMICPPSELLLTFDEVAQRLGVHIETVRRIVNRGELPYVSVGLSETRRYRRIRASSLAEWITSRERRVGEESA